MFLGAFKCFVCRKFRLSNKETMTIEIRGTADVRRVHVCSHCAKDFAAINYTAEYVENMVDNEL